MRIPFFRTIKSFVVSAITAATLTFAVLTAGTILDAHHQAWQEHHSPYYGEFEYYAANYLGSIHVNMLGKGFEPEGTLVSFIRWLHEIAHQHIMQKIPVQDGERDIWQYRFEILPQRYRIEYLENKSPSEVTFSLIISVTQRTIALVASASSKKIVSPFQRHMRLRTLIDASIFLDNHKDSIKSETQRDEYDKILFSSEITAIQAMQPANIFQQRTFYTTYSPLLFSYRTYIRARNNLFSDKNGILCHGYLPLLMVKLHNEIIPFWQNEYAKRGIVFAEQIDRITPSASEEALYQYGYQKRSRELRKLFKEQCGIELR
jgi:hypothetical protein